MPTFSKHTIGLIVMIITAMTFGIYTPAARAVYADGGNASFTVLIAMLARTFCLVAFCFVTKKKMLQTVAETKTAFYSGLMQAISVLSIFLGLVYLPAPIVIILIFTHTLMLLFYMAWRGEVKINAEIIITTLIALVGLSFVVNLWDQQSPSSILGIVIVLIGAVATVGRLYAFGTISKVKNPAVIGAETFIFATVFIILYQFFNIPHAPSTSTGYWWLLVVCVSQVIATFGMFYSIAFLGSFKYSLFMKMEPIFTCLFSFLFIGEVLNTTQYFGVFLVTASLVTYQYISHQKNKKLAQ